MTAVQPPPAASGVAAAPGIAAAPLDPEQPWPGLDTFRETDSAYFRGREHEIAALLQLILQTSVAVLYGRSGLGKSSLVQAGLFPRLRERLLLPVHVRVRYAADGPAPTEQMLQALRLAAEQARLEAPPLRPDDGLWEHLHRTDAIYWSPDNRPVTPVFVLDQFEELFTLGRREGVRERSAAFQGALADLAEGCLPASLAARLDGRTARAADFAAAQHRYKLLLVLREDFLAELDEVRVRMPSLLAPTSRMRLLPMRGDAGLEVTQAGGPALVPPAVGERIVRLVAGGAEETPLAELVVDPAILSFVLRELNERRRGAGQASLQSDWDVRERDEILAQFYRRSVDPLGPAVRAFVEDKLLTRSGFRDSVAVDRALGEPGVSEEVVESLVKSRLVRLEEFAGQPRIELTHDVLTSVVRRSRDERMLREEGERERLEKEREHARREAERERARVELAKTRRRLWLTAIACGVSVLLAIAAAVASLRLRDQKRTLAALKGELVATNAALEKANAALQDTISTTEENNAGAALASAPAGAAGVPLGTRPAPAGSPAATVTIQYFQKPSDADTLLAALRRLGHQVVIRRTLNDQLETNYLVYGSRVRPAEARRIALAVLGAGTRLRAICPFGSDRGVGGADRSAVVQVIGATFAQNRRLLTAPEVEAAQELRINCR